MIDWSIVWLIVSFRNNQFWSKWEQQLWKRKKRKQNICRLLCFCLFELNVNCTEFFLITISYLHFNKNNRNAKEKLKNKPFKVYSRIRTLLKALCWFSKHILVFGPEISSFFYIKRQRKAEMEKELEDFWRKNLKKFCFSNRFVIFIFKKEKHSN